MESLYIHYYKAPYNSATLREKERECYAFGRIGMSV